MDILAESDPGGNSRGNWYEAAISYRAVECYLWVSHLSADFK